MPETLATLASAAGLTLLHFLWQGALIGLAAAFALAALRRESPRARYAVAGFALLACTLLPLLTLATLLATPTTPAGGMEIFRARAEATPTEAAIGVLGGLGSQGILAAAPFLALFWAAGSSLLFARMAHGLSWIRRLRRAPGSAPPREWHDRLVALAARLGLERRVELLVVDTLDSPISAGCWRPIVVVPAALLTRMPADLIEALLAHELAHIRRHDYVLNLLQNAVEAWLFFHPVTWWLSHRLRVERESIADQLAAEVTEAPRRLAIALAELSALQAVPAGLRFAQAARGGELAARIERLVRPRCQTPPGPWFGLPLLLLVAAGLASFAYAQSGPRPHPPQQRDAARKSDPSRVTYALVRAGNRELLAWGPDDDIDFAAETHRAVDRDILLIRRGGRDHLVTDAALLAPVVRSWGEAEALERRLAEGYDRLTRAHANRAHDSLQSLEQELLPLERALTRSNEAVPRVLRHLLDEAWSRGLARPVETPSATG